jgi:DNA-binding NarL/FixJ family response regulator
LEKAITEVMSGETYFSNELLRKIICNFGRRGQQVLTHNEGLTDREMEILQHICLGLTTEEIAEKLFISAKTVKSHRSNLLEKTESKNTPGLIRFAVKNHLVEM